MEEVLYPLAWDFRLILATQQPGNLWKLVIWAPPTVIGVRKQLWEGDSSHPKSWGKILFSWTWVQISSILTRLNGVELINWVADQKASIHLCWWLERGQGWFSWADVSLSQVCFGLWLATLSKKTPEHHSVGSESQGFSQQDTDEVIMFRVGILILVKQSIPFVFRGSVFWPILFTVDINVDIPQEE